MYFIKKFLITRFCVDTAGRLQNLDTVGSGGIVLFAPFITWSLLDFNVDAWFQPSSVEIQKFEWRFRSDKWLSISWLYPMLKRKSIDWTYNIS